MSAVYSDNSTAIGPPLPGETVAAIILLLYGS